MNELKSLDTPVEGYMVKVNDIIQLTETAQEGWISCLMIVQEVKSWGVQAYMKLPEQGDAYLRIAYGKFEVVGHAVLVHPDSLIDEILNE